VAPETVDAERSADRRVWRPAKVAPEQLGHASISTTLDLYSHVVSGLQEDAAETVAGRLFGTAGT
jgi:hypothetical protein